MNSNGDRHKDRCPICTGEQDNRVPEKRAKRVLYFPGLVDTVNHHGRLKFLFKGEDEVLYVVDHFHPGGNPDACFVPPNELKHLKLCDGEAVISRFSSGISDKKLFDNTQSFIKKHVELPSESHYYMVSEWIFHTYLIEHFTHSPYLMFLGPADSGKSRALETIGSLAFRGYFVFDPSASTIFHMAEEEKVTLLIDEAHTLFKARDSNMRALLNVRFQKNLSVARRNPDNTATEHFTVFGATALASTDDINPVLKTRTIIINMEQATRRVADEIDERWAEELRQRLTVFRLEHLSGNLPKVKPRVRNRARDIARPFCQVNKVLGKKSKRLDEFFASLDKERSLELTQSPDADTLRALLQLRASGKIQDGYFFTCDVAEQMNQARDPMEQLKETTVGRLLSALGFKVAGSRSYHRGGSRKARCYDAEVFERLCERFAIEMPEESE